MHCVESMEVLFTRCNIKMFTTYQLISNIYYNLFMKL